MKASGSARPKYIYIVASNIKSPNSWSLQTKRYWSITTAREVQATQNMYSVPQQPYQREWTVAFP